MTQGRGGKFAVCMAVVLQYACILLQTDRQAKSKELKGYSSWTARKTIPGAVRVLAAVNTEGRQLTIEQGLRTGR